MSAQPMSARLPSIKQKNSFGFGPMLLSHL